MILKQYYLGCLAHASYFVGDEQTKSAVIVDPQRDIGQYLEDADQHDMTITDVFLTHSHADFVAGHLELREKVGANIRLGAAAKAGFEFKAMRDSESLEFGTVRMLIRETPGHTPESITILIYDLSASAEIPHAALTGDTLFIGDVGRPDLGASIGWSAEDLASLLYDSLHEKILPLPDETLVYPAHGAGSLCGKNLSKDTVSTIGVQRAYNYALQPMTKEAFISVVTADQPESPGYFAYDAEFNLSEHSTLDQVLSRELNPLTLETVIQKQNEGAQILDVRDGTDYEGGHLLGAMNIGLGGQYASWAGTLLDRSNPIILITEPGQEEEAAMRLGRIGFDHVVGFLDGGMRALDGRSDLLRQIDRITAAALSERLAVSEPPVIVDIRAPGEREQKRIEGSLHIPLNHLRERLEEIPRDRTIVVHCAGGYRSAMAVSIMEQGGMDNMMDMVGGIAAWEAVTGK
jgi:hydroxyacylglutathione hydrolase